MKIIIVQIILMLFPYTIRRYFLNKIFGFKIHKTAKIGFSLILCDKLEMEEYSYISHLTIVKPIDSLIMKPYARIGSLNFITGYNTRNTSIAKKIGFYKHIIDRKCELVLEEDAAITSRHFIDCNGGVYMGEHSLLAGIRSQILTHAIDVYNCRQDTEPVIIGRYAFVGTGCILLKGTVVPDYSIVGAGAVMNKRYTESLKIYGGVPAVIKKDISNEEIKFFKRPSGDVL